MFLKTWFVKGFERTIISFITKDTKGGWHRETRGISPTKLSNENKRWKGKKDKEEREVGRKCCTVGIEDWEVGRKWSMVGIDNRGVGRKWCTVGIKDREVGRKWSTVGIEAGRQPLDKVDFLIRWV